MDGTATFLRLSMDLDQWEASICAEEVERNPWKSYSTFIFLKYCQTVSHDWIFPIKKSWFFSSYVDKWNEIKYFTLTASHAEVRFGRSLRSAVWTKHCHQQLRSSKRKQLCLVSSQQLSRGPLVSKTYPLLFCHQHFLFCLELFGSAASFFVSPWAIFFCREQFVIVVIVMDHCTS